VLFNVNLKSGMLLSFLVNVAIASAASVDVTVVDSSGAPLKDALVILQALDQHGEVCRSLSDNQGRACLMNLNAGLYRVIGTMPYGAWTTTVREFIVNEPAASLKVSMSPQPTHGAGDVVLVGAPIIDVRVLGPNGEPVANADVLVRDREASLHLERRYRTDASGRARVDLVSSPTVIIAVFGGSLQSQEVDDEHPVTLRVGPPARR